MESKPKDKRPNKAYSMAHKPATQPTTTKDNRLVLQQNGFAARINKNLIVFKYFYFLFYSAAGTIFPFLVRYFYQIGLSNGQVLVLTSVRPTVHLLFGPFWGILGDRYVCKKRIIQFSLLIWLIVTISMAFLEPTDQECQLVTINESKTSVINSTTMKTGFFRRKRAVIDIVETPLTTEPKIETTINQGIVSGAGPLNENEDQTVPFSGSGVGSPTDQTLLHTTATKPPKTKQTEKHRKLKKTKHKVKQRNVLRENKEQLNHIFVNALFGLAIVEIFACPILVLIDAVVLSKQNEENFSYGQQRVFGSLGYLMFFFIVNALLQNSLRQVCGEMYADFVICFCFFALITIVTLIGTVKLPSMNSVSSCSGTRPFFRLRQIFYTKHFGTLIANICFIGFAHSFLENYFNSIVMDSKQVSYSTSVTINFFRSIGEPLALFFSSMVLNRAGIINVLFGIPLVTALNLFASSFITSPWHVIPLGFLDGCTYGISWVAYATYLIGSAPDDCTATVQGCFQSAFWGIGNGLRVLVGTSIMTLIGPSTSLRLFTIIAFCITVAFIIGLRNLHFTEQNFYTTFIRRLEGMYEEQVKCEVTPPIKHGGDSHNEAATAHRVTVMEKSERKKDGGKKENSKKGKYIEDNKF